MSIKTLVPKSNSLLAGTGLEIGDSDKRLRAIINSKTLQNQALNGNKCGHIPLTPRIFCAPIDHKRRKPFLESAKTRMEEAYFHPLKYDIAPIFYHSDKLNKDGSYRKLRSEKKEMATTLFGKAILHAVNLGSMVLGYFNDKLKKFIYYDLNYFAKLTGTSLKRVYRIAKLYKKHGYIEITERKQKQADGTYKSLSPRIKVTKKLFIDLGFAPEHIHFHCERAEKELSKKDNRKKDFNTSSNGTERAPIVMSDVAKKTLKAIRALTKNYRFNTS